MAGQSKKQAADRRARIAELQAAERARDRRNKIFLGAGALVIAAGAVVGIVAAVDHGGSASASTAGSATSVNWAAPTDTDAAVKAAGLSMLTAEGTAEHIHVHLDVWVNGQKTTVPALVGINENAQTISPLHTHDTTGVVHIESPVVKDYDLGQFMTEWGVPLSSTQLGPEKTDATHTLKVYVNGKETSGDPSKLVFHAHDEIAIVYGTAGDNAKIQIPSSYTWPSGL
ncbi:hypothetical protein DN069_30410 [Streptacidiphilus pinicola]|uniref:Uncharacterized protein n=1 Tax=Streptacidiphilus pinicola TaxID=2219663 RepID=A0A2X0J3C8_9ACTN|nr:hypothetical protein [Streptacidiphilus pinicola]RAG81888.1 hypothetical protein DN069_30410 [Streptacidiphilus pinicola]